MTTEAPSQAGSVEAGSPATGFGERRRSPRPGPYRAGCVNLAWGRTPAGPTHAIDPLAIQPEMFDGQLVPTLCDARALVQIASGPWPPRPSDQHELCQLCVALTGIPPRP